MDTTEMTAIKDIKEYIFSDNLTDFQKDIINRLDEFTNKEPEITFTWKDNQSEAKGYLVINSLKGNACGGGTRVHENVTVEEVTTLAKIMEIKFSFSGPLIGGAKTGICLDPNHPQKYAILARWYKAIKPILKSTYGTGSDLNTDIHKINQILQSLGIDNSQEGIINAVTKKDPDKRNIALSNMKLLGQNVKLTEGLEIPLAELATGYGVFSSIDYMLKLKGESLKGKRIFIQGVGNVGAATLWYLHKEGAKIVALSDHKNGIIFNDDINKKDILNVLKNKTLSQLENTISHKELNCSLEATPIDIFVPAAGSNLISRAFIDKLLKQGLMLISSGANHPFIEKEYCYGSCSQYLDNKLTLIPDFLANMGMARMFYYLMSQQDENNPLEINQTLDDIYQEIKNAIDKAYQLNNGNVMTASLYHVALEQIAKDSSNQTDTTTKENNHGYL